MEYTEDQLTEWFDIEKQKPLAPGVYLVFMEYGVERYSFFNGDRFNYVVSPESIYAIDLAFDKRNDEGAGSAVRKWRGMRSNPCTPTKPTKKANKRKTMYRVMAADYLDFHYQMIAGFFSKQEARAFIEHRAKLDRNLRFRISPLRFRTPEA